MLDHQRVADAQIGALQRLGDAGVLAGEPLDVGFVEHDPLRRDAGLADPCQSKASSTTTDLPTMAALSPR